MNQPLDIDEESTERRTHRRFEVRRGVDEKIPLPPHLSGNAAYNFSGLTPSQSAQPNFFIENYTLPKE